MKLVLEKFLRKKYALHFIKSVTRAKVTQVPKT